MIKKIKNIKNITVFKDFNWDSNIPDFKKYNAFYGWNGCGKTTITRLLSAFETVTLGKIELETDSKCVIETDNGIFTLAKNEPIPDSLKNRIRIFNEDFIAENLDWKAGTALKILIIGKDQMDQTRKLEDIIKNLSSKKDKLQIKEKEKKEKDKEKTNTLEKGRDEIKRILREANDVKPKSGRANDYVKYTVTDVENILKGEEFLSLEEDEILQLKQSLKESKAKQTINKINIDLGWIDKIIEKSQEIFIKVIPEEALRLLSDLGQTNERLKEWLRIGYEIHKNKQHPVECEFCKNEISEERFKELGEYFSEVLRNLISYIEQTIKDISSDNLPKLHLQKDQFYIEFQNEFLNLIDKFNKQLDIIREEIDKIKKALIEKKNNPSQTITFDFDILTSAIIELKNIVEQINSLIKKNNEKTNSFNDKRTESAHKLELAIISKYKSDYDKKIKDLKLLEEEIDSLNNEKQELENQQRELEQKLREHHFAAEEFNKLLKSFMGRSEIVLETVDEGYVIKRNERIANNLSEGE
ncbi:MAG: AAA family ATPase, partial [Minisyncoccia bacterium]